MAIKGFQVGGIVYKYQDSNIASEFEPNIYYQTDDLRLYDGQLYKCIIRPVRALIEVIGKK